MSTLNKVIKSAFKGLGLEVSRIKKQAPNPILYHKIELLFDVGANIGQYAMRTRESGYEGKIVSFEPLPDAFDILLKCANSDPHWAVHQRCAVGAELGVAEINISKNSYSSSLLPMLQAHASAAPESMYVGKAKTDVITLDSVFDAYRQHSEKTFLKIDTQGFEREVLNGLAINLKNIFAVQLELSILPLYGNQYLYKHFFEFFEANGFIIWTLMPGFFDRRSGQLLQFDAVFVRKS